MNESKAIAFFDFDGTITNRDIFWDYLFYRFKIGLSPLKIVTCIPAFILYLMKVWNNEKAKQIIFSQLFKGEPVDYFKITIQQYYKNDFLKRVKKDALNKILWHKNSNHKVYIVSANFDLILNKFARENQIELLATQVAVENNIITGKFATANCYGMEKVNRIKNAVLDLSSYTQIYAYGDSKGDLEMLGLATEKFYCFFKK
jgi:phosphatidylglycerophosphatase C